MFECAIFYQKQNKRTKKKKKKEKNKQKNKQQKTTTKHTYFLFICHKKTLGRSVFIPQN